MADKIFNAMNYFPDLKNQYPDSDYVPGMIKLVPNKDNRLHLQLFIQDTWVDEDNEQASWMPYAGEITTLFNTDIPCDVNAPLAFVDADGMFNHESSEHLEAFMYELGLGYEALSYSSSKNHVYPPVYKLDLDTLAKYDEAGVNRFKSYEPVTHVNSKEERDALRYSDKFQFYGQFHMEYSYEAYANTLVFRTPHQINGEDVYMMVNNYALERPDDPYNFQLYTSSTDKDEVAQLFFNPSVDPADFGDWIISRGTLDYMPRDVFKYSNATRGAENHSSFNDPIVDTLTDKVVSKEDLTKDIQDYIKTFHFELFFKYSSTDLQKERKMDLEANKSEPEMRRRCDIPEAVEEYDDLYPDGLDNEDENDDGYEL